MIAENARDIQAFIAPEGEDEELEQQVDLSKIVDHYTGKQGLEVVADEDEPEPPRRSTRLSALCQLYSAL